MDDRKNKHIVEENTVENIYINENLECNIKNLIVIKTNKLSFYELQNMIDYCILEDEKKINVNIFYTSHCRERDINGCTKYNYFYILITEDIKIYISC